jgi:G:T/U-mismatch repair DNA glycosylase/8-oxo-dGTP pyrophosphatase MutT (NUDIX family)
VAETPSAVPDVLVPELACVFCGINPGRVSAAAAAHFANPRNDFWRLLHDAGFTPRLYEPQEQHSLPELGYGLTNAAYRTTPGSGDLRRGDFDREEFEARIEAVSPRAVAFVGKEAYRGLWNERPELGPQVRVIGRTGLFVLPSTSPANAAVPYAERLRWFEALREWLVPVERQAVRALVLDADDRVLLVQFRRPIGDRTWWGSPGGGIDPEESHEAALRRELREEIGLEDFEIGPLLYEHVGRFPWAKVLYHQHNTTYLVRVHTHEPVPTIDLDPEGVADLRWWSPAELAASTEQFAPPDLPERVRRLTA